MPAPDDATNLPKVSIHRRLDLTTSAGGDVVDSVDARTVSLGVRLAWR